MASRNRPYFVPAGVRKNHAHPFDGADVHWTSATAPSHLPHLREREASRGASGAHLVRSEFDMYYSV